MSSEERRRRDLRLIDRVSRNPWGRLSSTKILLLAIFGAFGLAFGAAIRSVLWVGAGVLFCFAAARGIYVERVFKRMGRE